jgi:uncharacterized heparinase superfamily protein
MRHSPVYYQTVKNLSLTQKYWMVRRRVLGRRIPSFVIPDCPGLRTGSMEFEENYSGIGMGGAVANAPGRFSFLNTEHDVGWPIRWSDSDLPKLWLYNLHYFEWIHAIDQGYAMQVINQWIENNPLSQKGIGWDPYPTSLRLVSWTRLFCQSDPDSFSLQFTNSFARSVYLQALWLERNIEFEIGGNHIIENAVALILVGNLIDGKEATRWLKKGRALLQRELGSQIRSDGTHVENSPMYQLRIFSRLKLLAGTGDDLVTEVVADVLSKMRKAQEHLTHPDGEIALLNDSAFGVYERPAIVPSSRGHSKGAFQLPGAGYYGYADDEGDYVVCDVGRFGPDGQLAHAHGDVLSFEMSINSERIITDSGLYSYEDDSMRKYVRSTAAHNTVEINGEDQGEFWKIFRVGRRPNVKMTQWEPNDSGFSLAGTHDGYSRLPGKPAHRRRFHFEKKSGDVRFTLSDEIDATRLVTAVSRIHFAPNVRVLSCDGCRLIAETEHVDISVDFSGGKIALSESDYCPEFFTKVRRSVVTLTETDRVVRFTTSLCLQRKGRNQ